MLSQYSDYQHAGTLKLKYNNNMNFQYKYNIIHNQKHF